MWDTPWIRGAGVCCGGGVGFEQQVEGGSCCLGGDSTNPLVRKSLFFGVRLDGEYELDHRVYPGRACSAVWLQTGLGETSGFRHREVEAEACHL